jgi:hypothetical protein
MKKLIGLILYAGVMFGVTAGLGMFMLKKATPHADTAHGEEGEHSGETDGHASDVATSEHRRSENGDDAASHAGHADSGHEQKPTGRADEQLPVAVRANPMSVEEIVRMGLSLKSRDETVRKREAALKEMETQQKLAVADIQAAQQEIENLLAQASDQRAATEELLTRLKDQETAIANDRAAIAADRSKLIEDFKKLEEDRQSLTAKEESIKTTTEELAQKQRKIDTDQKAFNDEKQQYVKDLDRLNKQRDGLTEEAAANKLESERLATLKKELDVERQQLEQDRRLAGPTPGGAATDPAASSAGQMETVKFLESLPPERAASIITSMAKNEKTEAILDLLLAVDKKKAAQIFDAIEDPDLASELFTKMDERNRQTKAAEK